MAGQPALDAVFEGGGVKGIGLAGAVAYTRKLGYEFQNVAGTSAGAIVAALVAAGYDSDGLRGVMDALDYNALKDKGFLDHFGIPGMALSVLFEKGIYEGRYFESWMREQLANSPVGRAKLAAGESLKFKHLLMPGYEDQPESKYHYRLQVIATDITNGCLLQLPGDIADYGEDPDEMEVAHAVRMSMSIPYFFEPVKIHDKEGCDCYVVDGGVLSNYPVWIFDDGTPDPAWPTIGFKLVGNMAEGQERSIHHAVTRSRVNVRGALLHDDGRPRRPIYQGPQLRPHSGHRYARRGDHRVRHHRGPS